MTRDLEDELRARTVAGEIARDVIADLLARGAIASWKQAWRTLEKWSARGRWDYGSSIDLGWPVDTDGTPILRGQPAASSFAEAEIAERARFAAGRPLRTATPPVDYAQERRVATTRKIASAFFGIGRLARRVARALTPA